MAFKRRKVTSIKKYLVLQERRKYKLAKAKKGIKKFVREERGTVAGEAGRAAGGLRNFATDFAKRHGKRRGGLY